MYVKLIPLDVLVTLFFCYNNKSVVYFDVRNDSQADTYIIPTASMNADGRIAESAKYVQDWNNNQINDVRF